MEGKEKDDVIKEQEDDLLEMQYRIAKLQANFDVCVTEDNKNKMVEHTSNTSKKIITIEAENSASKERLTQNVTEMQSLKEYLEVAKVKFQYISCSS